MRIRTLVASIAIAGVSAGGAFALSGGTPANAATVSHHHRTTAAERTCSAFRTWEHHRTTDNIDRVMADSVHAPWQLIGVSAVVLYTDVKSAENITADVRDMAAACKGH